MYSLSEGYNSLVWCILFQNVTTSWVCGGFQWEENKAAAGISEQELHRIHLPSSSDALICSPLLSISLPCERALSIMPQVHIKEMGTDRYTCNYPCSPSRGSLGAEQQLPFFSFAARTCMHVHAHAFMRVHNTILPLLLKTLNHPFLTFTCQVAWLIRPVFTVKQTADAEGRKRERVGTKDAPIFNSVLRNEAVHSHATWWLLKSSQIPGKLITTVAAEATWYHKLKGGLWNSSEDMIATAAMSRPAGLHDSAEAAVGFKWLRW